MQKLSSEQIYYLRDVLGVESVVLPVLQTVSPTVNDVASEWRTSGDENAAKAAAEAVAKQGKK